MAIKGSKEWTYFGIRFPKERKHTLSLVVQVSDEQGFRMRYSFWIPTEERGEVGDLKLLAHQTGKLLLLDGGLAHVSELEDKANSMVNGAWPS